MGNQKQNVPKEHVNVLYSTAGNFDQTLTSPGANNVVIASQNLVIPNRIVVDTLFFAAEVETNTGCNLILTFTLNDNILFVGTYVQNIGTGSVFGVPALFSYLLPIEKDTVLPPCNFKMEAKTDINGAGNAIRVRGNWGLIGTTV